MRLEEYERAMNIMYHYGNRLDRGNLHKGALLKLITNYPSHNFCIDRKEAESLFKEIREPNQMEKEMLQQAFGVAKMRREQKPEVPVIEFLGPRSRIEPDLSKGGGDNARKKRKSQTDGSAPDPPTPGSDLKDSTGSRRPRLHPKRPETDGKRGPAPKRRGGKVTPRNGKPDRD